MFTFLSGPRLGLSARELVQRAFPAVGPGKCYLCLLFHSVTTQAKMMAQFKKKRKICILQRMSFGEKAWGVGGARRSEKQGKEKEVNL